MAETKKYRASTGVDEFYYAPLDESGTSVTTRDPERIKFAQSMEIEMDQEVVRAYGDNKTAELAVSNGGISVTAAFHTLPEEDKKVLLGLESTSDGLYAIGSTDNPPYVACVFAKTYEDGSKEWVGLTKGIFIRPKVSASTKEDKTEFTKQEITAEFMDRKVDGFSAEKSVIFGADEKGSTAARDALFKAVFGRPYPGSATPPGA